MITKLNLIAGHTDILMSVVNRDFNQNKIRLSFHNRLEEWGGSFLSVGWASLINCNLYGGENYTYISILF